MTSIDLMGHPEYERLQLPEERRAFLRGAEAFIDEIGREEEPQAWSVQQAYLAGWDAAEKAMQAELGGLRADSPCHTDGMVRRTIKLAESPADSRCHTNRTREMEVVGT